MNNKIVTFGTAAVLEWKGYTRGRRPEAGAWSLWLLLAVPVTAGAVEVQ
jgi:hypothetical protein